MGKKRLDTLDTKELCELIRVGGKIGAEAQSELWRRAGHCTNCGAPLDEGGYECPGCGYV